jgi:cell division protein FtsZ
MSTLIPDHPEGGESPSQPAGGAGPAPGDAAQTVAAGLLKKPLVMKIIGVGGAGCNALAHMAQAGLADIAFMAMNTDARALDNCAVADKFVLGARVTRGLGAGGDPERGRAAAEDDRETLTGLCAGADVVFVVAGLGGGTGTGAAPVVAQLARQHGALVLGMVVLPFDCEGARRQRQALLGLHQLKAVADSVICLPNQRLLALVADKTSVAEGFAMAHDLLARGVKGVWRLLTQPGLINVDFADVCTVTRERHAECALATAEAQGEGRARELLEKLLKHPLMEEGRVLNDAAAVLVSLVGGPDLSLTDVNAFMEQINRHCDSAHIIMGAALDESYSGRLAATVLSTRRLPREKAALVPEGADAASDAPTPEPQFVHPSTESRLPARHVAPPPVITTDNAEQMLQGLPSRVRRRAIKMVQGQLPLEIVSRGRFEKSEPTIRSGQDLDVPTYLRRNLVFN